MILLIRYIFTSSEGFHHWYVKHKKNCIMADEKLEKAAEEEDQSDLYDPKLRKGDRYFGMTKKEVEDDIEWHERMAQAHEEEEEARYEAEQERLVQEKARLKELVILQTEENAVFERDWENAPTKAKRQYHDEDFPKFVQTLRTEVLELTLEAMGYSIGVSKNQMARIENGASMMTPSNMLLMFDQVEKALMRKEKEWYFLGEFEVDQLIPDMYKKLRGWIYGRQTKWHYNPDLVVNNAIPPRLARLHPVNLPDSDPTKMDKMVAHRTKEEQELIKNGDLDFENYAQTKYSEDAIQKVEDAPKKKPKEIVIAWAVIEQQVRNYRNQDEVSEEELKNFKSQIETLTRKMNTQSRQLERFSEKEKELQEKLDRTTEKLDVAEKMTAVYEHQMRHNKAMADQGLVNAIIGLPTPAPGKLTVADIDEIPEEVQEKIYNDWYEEHIQDLAADAQMDDAKFERNK